jgi:hypothetical protein
MADEDNKITIEVSPDEVKFVEGLRRMESKAQKAGEQLGDGLETGVKKGLNGIALAVGATVAGFAALRAVKNFLGDAVDAAAEGEVALNRLNTSLRLAGTYSKEASQQFVDMANEIQRTTTIEDDAALSLAALARNMTKTNEEAIKLTKAAIDLGAATGKGPEAALQQLGTTLSGTSGQLARRIPELQQYTEAQLRAGAAIDLVAEKFKGFAAAETNTFNGALSQLRNSFNSFQESIGGFVTQSPVVVALVKQLADIFMRLSGSISEVGKTDIVGALIIELIKFADAVNTFVVAPIEMVYNGLEIVFNGIRTAIQGLVAGIINATSGIVNIFAPNSELAQNLNALSETTGATFTDMAAQTRASLDDIFNFDFATKSAEFIEGFRTTAEQAGAISQEMGNKIGSGVEEGLKKAKKEVFDLGRSIGQGIATTVQQAVTAIAQGQNAFKAIGNALLGVIGDIAIQLGTFFITTGLGLEALVSNPFTAGAAAVAAGVALVAFGALMKSIAGSGAGGAAVSAGQPGSGVPGGGVSADASGSQGTTDQLEERQARVQVNIQGDVLDSRESGLRIVDLINEAFDTDGARVLAT